MLDCLSGIEKMKSVNAHKNVTMSGNFLNYVAQSGKKIKLMFGKINGHMNMGFFNNS